jgi:two-component system cell cycle response regulator
MNDEYGYHAGDKVLTYAGHLIQKNIRKFDRAFRYSNREFIIVLPETDLTFAYIAAERIRKSFQNKMFSVHKKEDGIKDNISRTASIGITAVSSYRIKDISIDDLIDQAAKALHIARAKGGNVSIRYE